jgi:cellulose synthase/poly-beta-1,6-N-acetylglucosamine synthase-like glycosyltransferase
MRIAANDVIALALVLAIGIVAYAYAGYPFIIWLFSRLFGRRPHRPELEEYELPRLSLVIAAYNEEAEIGRRLQNALELDYPADKLEIVIASDGSTDRTNSIVRKYERYGVRLIAFPHRRGKASVLNDVFPELSGDVVMLSDANTYTHSTAAARLAAWFREPGIGVVCGRLVLTDPVSGRNVDSLYWKYETFLKKCEGRLGALVGSNGGIYAIRKSLFRGIPSTTIVDDFLIPLLAHKRNRCGIVYDREAVAMEETPARLSSEFHRRARIGAGGFQSIAWLIDLLNPRYGWVSFTFWSHKVLRWLCPFALIAALFLNVLLIREPLFRALLVGQLGFYGVSLVAGLIPARLRSLRYLRLGTMFTTMNAALLVGFFRCLSAGQSAAWKRTERSPQRLPRVQPTTIGSPPVYTADRQLVSNFARSDEHHFSDQGVSRA